MTKVRCLIGLALISSFLLSLDSKNAVFHGDERIRALLPAKNEIEGWERHFDCEEYLGEDLFFYINGGAEIYHEYGFEQVIVQDYRSKNGRSASLEIYKMSSPLSAYGMYTFKSSGKGEILDLAHGGKLQDYYLNFWKGSYLVTITGFDANTETIDGLKSIANAVENKIRTNTNPEMPAIFAQLPPDDLDAQSVKYFRGHLGLVNCYPFAHTDIFEIQEGIKGSYSDGYDIYILAYEEAKESQRAFDRVIKSFTSAERYRNMSVSHDRIDLEDEKRIRIVVEPYGNFILILLGAESSEDADQILKDLKKHIS